MFGFSILVRAFFCLSLKYHFQAPLLTWVSTLPNKFFPPHPLPKAYHYSILICGLEKHSCFWRSSALIPFSPLKKKKLATTQKINPSHTHIPATPKHCPPSFPGQISQINDHSWVSVPSHTLSFPTISLLITPSAESSLLRVTNYFYFV